MKFVFCQGRHRSLQKSHQERRANRRKNLFEKEEAGREIKDKSNRGDKQKGSRSSKIGKTRGRASKHAQRTELLEAHLQRFQGILRSEVEAKLEQVKDRIESRRMELLVDQGYCIRDLQSSATKELFGESFIVFSLDPEKKRALPVHHHFVEGSAVLITSDADDPDLLMLLAAGASLGLRIKEPSNLDVRSFPGIVVKKGPTSLLVSVIQPFADALLKPGPEARWRLDVSIDTEFYERILTAMECLAERVPPSSQEAPRESRHVFRLLLFPPPQLGREPVDFLSQARGQPPWMTGERGIALRKRCIAYLEGLSEGNRISKSQRQAPLTALTQRITLWHEVESHSCDLAVVLYMNLLTRVVGEVSPVLLVSDNKVATYKLATDLISSGLKVVLVGDSIPPPSLQSVTLNAWMAKHPAGLRARNAWLRAKSTNKQAIQTASPGRLQNLKEMRREIVNLLSEAKNQVLETASVVICTCNESGGKQLNGKNFRVCVIDDANHTTEPSALVPLVKGIESVLLIGRCTSSQPANYSDVGTGARELGTLFERFLDQGITPISVAK